MDDQKGSISRENRTRKSLGLNLHEQLRIETVLWKLAELNATEYVEEIDPTSEFWKDFSVNRYTSVFSRLGRSKTHQVFTNFKDPPIPRQVKGRKIPIHNQDRVTAKIRKLIRDETLKN